MDFANNNILHMPFTDDQIRQAVANLFKKYDKDNSGYIEAGEINPMCNDLGRELASRSSTVMNKSTRF